MAFDRRTLFELKFKEAGNRYLFRCALTSVILLPYLIAPAFSGATGFLVLSISLVILSLTLQYFAFDRIREKPNEPRNNLISFSNLLKQIIEGLLFKFALILGILFLVVRIPPINQLIRTRYMSVNSYPMSPPLSPKDQKPCIGELIGIVESNHLSMRIEHSEESREVHSLTKGDSVEVIKAWISPIAGKHLDWFHIRTVTCVDGWVPSDSIQLVEPSFP